MFRNPSELLSHEFQKKLSNPSFWYYFQNGPGERWNAVFNKRTEIFSFTGLSIFARNPNIYKQFITCQRKFIALKLFGDTLKAVLTHWQKNLARGPQKNSEERSFAKHKVRTKFLRTRGRQFSPVCQSFFARSSTSNRSLKFFQKYVFLTSIFGKCKKQFQQLPDGFLKVSKKLSI